MCQLIHQLSIVLYGSIFPSLLSLIMNLLLMILDIEKEAGVLICTATVVV